MYITCISIAFSVAALAFDPLVRAYGVKLFAMSLTALLFAMSALLRPKGRPAILPVGWKAGAVFVALSALSLLWGSCAGLVDLALWLSGACLFYVLCTLSRNTRTRIASVAAGAIASLASLASVVERARHLPPTGGMGNPDWLGLTLAAALPMCAHAAVHARGRSRLLFSVATLLALPGLVLSQSRTAWGSLAVTAILVAIAARASRGSKKADFVQAGLLGAAGPSSLNLRPQAGFFREAILSRAFDGRVWIYRETAHAIGAHPIFGSGLGRYGFAYLEAQGHTLAGMRTQEASRWFVNATTAHNDYLQVACESGIPTSLALVLFFVQSLRGLYRARAWGALGSALAVVTCAVGDSPLRLPAVVLLLALALSQGSPAYRSSRAGTRVFAFVAFACTVLASMHYTSTRLESKAALVASQKAEPMLRRALVFDTSGEVAFDLGVYLLATGRSEEAARFLEQSNERFANVGTWVALGNAYAANGDWSRARDAFEHATHLHPGSLKGQANLAEAERQLGHLAEARQAATRARAIAPFHPKVLDLLEHLEIDSAASEELKGVDIDDDGDVSP